MLLALLMMLISGAVIGWIAGSIMKEPGSMWHNIIVGIVGSALGGFLFSLVGFHATGFFARLIVDLIGACLLLWLVDFFTRKTR